MHVHDIVTLLHGGLVWRGWKNGRRFGNPGYMAAAVVKEGILHILKCLAVQNEASPACWRSQGWRLGSWWRWCAEPGVFPGLSLASFRPSALTEALLLQCPTSASLNLHEYGNIPTGSKAVSCLITEHFKIVVLVCFLMMQCRLILSSDVWLSINFPAEGEWSNRRVLFYSQPLLVQIIFLAMNAIDVLFPLLKPHFSDLTISPR